MALMDFYRRHGTRRHHRRCAVPRIALFHLRSRLDSGLGSTLPSRSAARATPRCRRTSRMRSGTSAARRGASHRAASPQPTSQPRQRRAAKDVTRRYDELPRAHYPGLLRQPLQSPWRARTRTASRILDNRHLKTGARPGADPARLARLRTRSPTGGASSTRSSAAATRRRDKRRQDRGRWSCARCPSAGITDFTETVVRVDQDRRLPGAQRLQQRAPSRLIGPAFLGSRTSTMTGSRPSSASTRVVSHPEDVRAWQGERRPRRSGWT